MDKTMNQTIWQHRGLPLLLYAYASLADWALTQDALSIGHTEGNPIMRQFDSTGMLLFKIVAFVFVLACVWLLDKLTNAVGMPGKLTMPTLWVVAFGQMAVVGWNVLVVVIGGSGW